MVRTLLVPPYQGQTVGLMHLVVASPRGQESHECLATQLPQLALQLENPFLSSSTQVLKWDPINGRREEMRKEVEDLARGIKEMQIPLTELL